MSIKKISRTNLTLFVFLLAIGLVNASSHHVAGGISRRDHSSLKRLVKKRAAADSTTDSNDSTGAAGSNKAAGALGLVGLLPGTSTSATGTATSASESATSLSSASAASATSASVSASDSLSASASASASATSASVSATELSKSAPTTTASPTTDTTQPTNVDPGTTTLIRTLSQSAGDAEETKVNNASSTNALGTKGKTALITVLIIVASCVGGVAIFWTVFRKWKLGRSSKFDQRLQPIDWQPTHDDDDIIPHRLASDNASLRSGRGYGATSDHGHGSDNSHRGFDPLDHDFTAGSTNLAPVGGYADLARGSSPQPPMQESMNYGPSITRPNYDVGVPLHHQTNYGAHEAYDSGRY